MSPPAAGPRRVTVEAERLEGFLTRLADRHGALTWTATPAGVTVTAGDGFVAECRAPFPPLVVNLALPYGGLLAHVTRDRVVGVVLVRRGGYAAGVFAGVRLTASKVGSRNVQGRSAAGGWSQQRFARRREDQARMAFEAAAGVVAAVVLPAVSALDSVVAGGDRASCDRVLSDSRLAPLLGLLAADRLDVPDPRLRVLEGTPRAFRSVHVTITDPEPR